jgi:DNA-binding NarL/FixJ family response regulator
VITDDNQQAPVGRPRGSTSRPEPTEVIGPGECADAVRVLVVEPDLFFAEFVAGILRDARPEFVVREVPSLGRALDHLFEAQGAELIITNVTLADDAGPPVPASLRRAAPDAAIFVLCATSDPDLAGECLRRGADRVLPKRRLTADSFLAAIREVVGWSL